MSEDTAAPETTALEAIALEPDAFAPYGEVIAARGDGDRFGPTDARLQLEGGIPRFYVMQLHDRAPAFSRITRHRAVTQCLASADGVPWLVAVAPPDDPDDPGATPDRARLAAFAIPPGVAVKLHRGTWHAGPYFEGPSAAFFNLELSDTNEVDHHTVDIGPHVIEAG